MTLAGARITHQVNYRIRFRIPERRGDSDYFNRVVRALTPGLKGMEIRATPETGSLLIQGTSPDPNTIFALAEEKGLFARAKIPPRPAGPIVHRLSRAVVSGINDGIRKVTANQLDIPSAAFLALVIHAVREIARGNLTTPSWFTALWFAASIYNGDLKGLGSDDGGNFHGDDGGSHG